MTYEALNGLGSTLNELYDYVIMMSAISDKYEKYPRHFLTTHKIASRNYNRLKTEFEEEIFNKRIDKTLEYTYQDYKFIYPKTTNEIKDEAVQQNNCVSSYIKNVIDGKCHILFMRKKII
ncbi:PcfJ domain-containing protein [Clostridioides difficile]